MERLEQWICILKFIQNSALSFSFKKISEIHNHLKTFFLLVYLYGSGFTTAAAAAAPVILKTLFAFVESNFEGYGGMAPLVKHQ